MQENKAPEPKPCFWEYTVSNPKEKPTNSEFIALIANKLQLKSSKVSNY